VEKYHNPLMSEGESYDKNLFMLLISVVYERRKEIGGNYHA